MKVQDVMIEDVKYCRPETNLAEAAALMWENDCGALPVLADDGKVIGVITDRDIAVALGTRNSPASSIEAKAVISGRVFACAANEDIHSALDTMRKQKVRRLPVINDRGLIEGILCINDIVLKARRPGAGKTVDITYEDVIDALKALCEHHPKPATEQPQAQTAAGAAMIA